MSASVPNRVDSGPAPHVVGANLGNASDSEVHTARLSISLVRSNHNSLLPVSLLPAELLSCIFLELRDAAPPSRQSSADNETLNSYGWLLVTRVCSVWRSTALACANLWTDIPFDLGRRWAEVFVTRSKSASLTIPPMFEPSLWQHNLVSAQISRIVNLVLLTDSISEFISYFDLMKTHTPNQLVKLDLQPFNNLTIGDEYSDILHRAPQLRHVGFSDTSLPWDMLPWTRLRSVNISMPLSDNSGMSDLSLLITSLANAAVLEDLDLAVFAFRFHFQTHSAPSPVIAHLPRLQSLSFTGRTTDSEPFLNAIRIPTTARLSLTVVPDGGNNIEPPIMCDLLRVHTGHEPNKPHRRVRTLQLICEYEDGQDYLKAWQSYVDFGLGSQLPMSKPAPFIDVAAPIPEHEPLPEEVTPLQTLCKNIKLDYVCQLRLSLFASELDNTWAVDTWHNVFSSARGVQCIRLDGPWIHRFFQALLFEQETDISDALLNAHGRQARSLFPSLSTIQIVGFRPTPAFASQFGSIAAWVERRAQHAPIKMMSIRNSTINYSEVEKLRAIEGLEVDWDGRRRCYHRPDDEDGNSDSDDDDDDEWCGECDGYGCAECVGSDFDDDVFYDSDFHIYD